jgi:predicted permease
MIDGELRPPVVSRRLLEWAGHRLDTPELADDAAELFVARSRRDGERGARRWYRRQARASVGRVLFPHGAQIRWRGARSRIGAASARECRRAPWPTSLWEGIVDDLHQAQRSLTARPGWTVAVLLTLSLGIGSSSAVYSVVDAVVLRPLPYEEPERLRVLAGWDVERQREIRVSLSYPAWSDLRRRQDVFERMGAYTPMYGLLTHDGTTEPIFAAWLSASMLQVLGVEPRLGRGFTAADDEPGAAGLVILSHGAWQRRFAGDPQVLGRRVLVNHEPHRIVGVMPEGFAFPDPTRELWLSLATLPRGNFLTVVGRLAPDVTAEQAAARLSTLEIDTGRDRRVTARTISLHARIVGDVDRLLFLLLGAVGVVLLIAAVNVGGLMMSRAVSRRAEHRIRQALGASRAHLARAALVESMLIAAAGSMGGLLPAVWFTDAMLSLRADMLPRQSEIGLHPRVLLFTGLAALGLALAAGIAPFLGRRRNGGTALTRTPGSTGGRVDALRRSAPVVAQIALTTVLLFAAGLLLRSLSEMLDLARGFERDGVVILRTRLPEERYPEHAVKRALYDEIEERLTATPAVTSMALADLPPYLMQRVHRGVEVERATGESELAAVEVLAVSAGFFETLRVPVLEGRLFRPAEPQPVVVINRTMARTYWPEGTAIGKQVGSDWLRSQWGDAPPATVVGIVADTRWGDLQPEPAPQVYFPYDRRHNGDMVAFLRVQPGAAAEAIATTRALLRDIDPGIAILELGTLDDRLAHQVADPRFRGALLGTFAAMALVLTFFGIFGVVWYTVAASTRDLGVRKALGARPGGLLSTVLRRAGALALVGVTLGGIGAWWTAHLLEAYLFEVRPHDPWIFGAVAALVTATAIGAALPPACRAARVDPMVVLDD